MPEKNIKSLPSEKKIKGIKAQNFNAILMIAGCLLTLFVFYTSLGIKSKYDDIVFSMNDYSECNKAIYDLKNASELLTEQARLFVRSKSIACLHSYFYELTDLKRREMTMEIVEMTHKDDIPDVNLKLAYFNSENLVQNDLYAMKLVIEVMNFSDEDIPELLKNVDLLESDKKLTGDAKLLKAQDYVYGEDYDNLKARMDYYLDCANKALINMYVTEQQKNDSAIKSIFAQQVIFMIILFFTCIIFYVFLLKLIIIPLYNNLVCIQKNAKMKLKGAYEVKYIASAYNALCDKNAITASVLKHKAEHDPLTGLINRDAFNQIKEALSDSGEPIAYLIIDIDLFKQINDKHGHIIGDEVLKKISNMLMEQFRATDYVARIGGDEFAVIMTKFGMSPVDIIQRKISELNKRLQTVEDDLPPVSLSVGVAFSEEGYVPEVEADADKALYNVKRGGRCNCSFYEKK